MLQRSKGLACNSSQQQKSKALPDTTQNSCSIASFFALLVRDTCTALVRTCAALQPQRNMPLACSLIAEGCGLHDLVEIRFLVADIRRSMII